MEGRVGRYGLALWSLLVVLFLWVPLGIILVYAFNTSNIQSWPIPGFTLKWFRVAWEDQEARTALMLSLKAAFAATAVALVLGTMAAVAVSRFRFFGREAFSFLLVLPLALPGVVAGSIFTFSLTLGDYITPILVGNTQFIGNVVYRNVLGLTYNLPFAAAYATVPLAVMAIYLLAARRAGAFEAL